MTLLISAPHLSPLRRLQWRSAGRSQVDHPATITAQTARPFHYDRPGMLPYSDPDSLLEDEWREVTWEDAEWQ